MDRKKLIRKAVIDLGTNTFNLLIAEFSEKKWTVIYNQKIGVLLGMGGINSQTIAEDAMARGIQAMVKFKDICDDYMVHPMAIGTSALRDAKNKNIFINDVHKKTGIKIEVISGDEEARTILKAFELIQFNKEDPFIIIDVGGGSTEISIFENGNKKSSKSFKIGTLRLINKKVKENCWDKIQEWILENIQTDHTYKIFGTGGNINKIHKILEGKQMVALQKESIVALKNKLEPMSNLERMHHYSIKPDRTDVIIPAMDIFLFILNQLNADSITVPKIGLSDGIIYKLHLSDTLTTE